MIFGLGLLGIGGILSVVRRSSISPEIRDNSKE
jgi:hypothetical protein